MIKIRNVVFDVDGVFTDGTFYYDDTGKVLKKFGPHDADGVKLLRSLGFQLWAISADRRGFAITKKRMDDIGIPIELVSEENRTKYISTNFGYKNTVFVGDGLHDAPCLRDAVLSLAPENACIEAKNAADIVLKETGGSGFVFEACKIISKLCEAE